MWPNRPHGIYPTQHAGGSLANAARGWETFRVGPSEETPGLEVVMKKFPLLMLAAIGAAIAVRRLLPSERRAELRERLAEMPATMMERCMESMPEDSPPKVMVSGIRRIEEQNDELISALREQNELLRKQNELLSAREPASAV